MTDKEILELRKAVTFFSLISNGDSIFSKTPKYVLEQWKRVKTESFPESILDPALGIEVCESWLLEWSQYFK